MRLVDEAWDGAIALADYTAAQAAALADLAEEASESATEFVGQVSRARRWLRVLPIVVAATGLIALVMVIVRSRRTGDEAAGDEAETPVSGIARDAS